MLATVRYIHNRRLCSSPGYRLCDWWLLPYCRTTYIVFMHHELGCRRRGSVSVTVGSTDPHTIDLQSNGSAVFWTRNVVFILSLRLLSSRGCACGSSNRTITNISLRIYRGANTYAWTFIYVGFFSGGVGFGLDGCCWGFFLVVRCCCCRRRRLWPAT